MAKLSIVLPPFAPDYSGVVSAFFDLPALVVIHDASGCTGNYTGYDEPRWYGSRSAVFCSALRDLDAILGDDAKLINKTVRACEDMKPQLVALVGSPVPMVVGSDMAGIAAELEARLELPCFGFDTTGTSYYDQGIAAAAVSLLDRFAYPVPVVPRSVNILGATPLDFSDGGDLFALLEELKLRSTEVICSMSMGCSLTSLKYAAGAQVNLVVSRAGLAVAQHLEKKFGTPYLCGLPFGKKAGEAYFECLETLLTHGTSLALKGLPSEKADVLILGEQVRANALRCALNHDTGEEHVVVGSLFGLERSLALSQDLDLGDEASIRKAMNGPWKQVIADPLLQELLKTDASFLPFPHYAISSKASGMESSLCVGNGFYSWLCRTTSGV